MRRILIVDHEARSAVEMARALRSAGHDVLEAPTGSGCLVQAHEKRPHLILVDEGLPDISGIDLVRQIRRDAELSQTYLALLIRQDTAPAIQARALEVGADALIERGALPREFLGRVEALLRRQTAEEGVRTALQDYRATFDAMSDAVYLVNMEFKIIDCNLAMARLLGRPRGDIVGGRCYELVHGTTSPMTACLGQRVRESRRRETLVVSMEERWLQVDVDPLLDANGAVIGSVHVLRDITERRHTEETLQRTQAEMELRAAEHQTALDQASRNLQAEVDARLRTQEVLKGTQADLELRNREHEQLAQTYRGAEENLQRVQRELRTMATQAADLVYTWEVQTGQVHLVSDVQGRFAGAAGGFPATLGELQGMIHPSERAAAADVLAQHVSDGTPWRGEYRLVHHDGQVARWAVSVAPLGDAGAQEWMAVVRDVTVERRSAQEQNLLRTQRQQTQKMEALRRLALGVANEFNRLLARILGELELMLARMEPAHPLHKELQAIAQAARVGVLLIRRLLAFAGRELLQVEELDLNEQLRKLEPELQRIVGRNVTLEWRLAPQLRHVLADARVLQDVWLNLAAQGAQAMAEGGTLRVHSAGVTLTEGYVRTRPAVAAGDYVRVTLAHRTAVPAGAPAEDLFELRLAASATGAGDELGLGVVYGLVQQLGGFIEVSEVAGETAWEVYLPACASDEGAEETGTGAPEGGGVEEWEGLGPAGGDAQRGRGGEAVAETGREGDADRGAPTEVAERAVQGGVVSEVAVEAPVTGEGVPGTGVGASLTGEGEPVAGEDVPVTGVGASLTGEDAVTEPGLQVPAWLTGAAGGEMSAPASETPAVALEPSSDITDSPTAPDDAGQPPTGDITESKPSPPSGLAALRSRFRRLRKNRE